MIVIACGTVRGRREVKATPDRFEQADRAASRRSLIRSLALGALGLAIGYAPMVQAQSDPLTRCGPSIASCGCTIIKKGNYDVSANLSASQGLTGRGDCIDIKAAKATLDLKGFTVTGSGEGTAILVLKTANKSTVDGSGSVIEHWGTGLEARGNKVTVGNIDAESNSIGVLVNKGSKGSVSNLTASNNSTAGIVLNGVHDGTLSNFEASNNGVFGVWLQSSNNNDEVSSGDASDNGNTGIFLGCSSTGPTGTKCGVRTSKNNRITGNTANNNGQAGIALDLGNRRNHIRNNDATGNSGLDDLVDENLSCDKNDWSGNSFGSANETCVH
jgi:parallel beta-helix repeat protein